VGKDVHLGFDMMMKDFIMDDFNLMKAFVKPFFDVFEIGFLDGPVFKNCRGILFKG